MIYSYTDKHRENISKGVKEYYKCNPNKIKELYKNNPEIKTKISNTLKEYYKNHPEKRQLISEQNKNRSDETKNKISNTLKKQYKDNTERLQQIKEQLKEHIPWNKGTRGIMKLNSGSFKKGLVPWNKNRKCPEISKGRLDRKLRVGYLNSTEARRKIGEGNRGDKSGMWRGGLSFEPYGLAWTRGFRQSIRERDNHCCQLCEKHQSQLKKSLSIHHIDYVKTNCFTFNCISLCITCHAFTNSKRQYWKNFFQQYLRDKYGYSYISQQNLLVDVVSM